MRMGPGRSVVVTGLCLSLAWLSTVLGQDAAMGCGGFVRSKKNIDFSRIEVELETLTPSGGWRKVGVTDCAPNNGYYFLPVESHGSYKIRAKPPPGWKISPDYIQIDVNGQSDSCSTNQDVNFEFVGFGITGSVKSKDTKSGPSGIVIELMEKGSLIQTAMTDTKGDYVFFGVLPGRYNIRIGSESQKVFSFDKVSLEVDVGDNEGITKPFFISGYSLDGQITNRFGLQMENIEFGLYSNGKLLKKTKSDAQGLFKFTNVAVGNYEVKVEVAKNLELDQRSKQVTVEHQHSQLPSFVVKSFSAVGSVLSSLQTKKPLKGAAVKASTADGANWGAVSDEKGRFEFSGINSAGPLTTKVILDGYDFETATHDALSPQTELKAIVPARYRLSGNVDRSSMPSSLEIKVKFVSETDSNNVGSVIVSEKGTFSIYLPSGRYVVSVELKADQKGFGFAPVQRAVDVVEGPITGINFQPIKADVGGSVAFFGPSTSSSLEVALSSDSGTDLQKQVVKADGTFLFSGILPGKYTVSVLDSGNRCWSQPVQELTVSSDVKDIQFKQLGHYVEVESAHSTLLQMVSNKGDRQEAVLTRGTNTICIENSGKSDDVVTFSTKGCETFEVTPSSWSPSLKQEKVVLKPTRYQVSGRIASKVQVSNLQLVAKSEQRQVKLTTKRDDRGYSFSFDAFPGEDVSFVPQSEEFLFDPETVHVFVDHACHLEAVQFEAVSGFFLRGQIVPPVEGVLVKVANLPASQANRKYATSSTDQQGNYRLGPLPKESGTEYAIEATKEGYLFEPVAGNRGHFKSKKLAAIVVEVFDDRDQALSGAVVSVSGGTAYRSNTHSDAKGGASFLSLSPGEYFVKPQLKEFEFTPKHKLMNIKEGETSSMKFVAKRVAFSAYGKVRSINGEPETGITLRAKGIRPETCVGLTEEATSESKGEFRFRGLVPGCHYSIGLREGSSTDIEKLIPKDTTITMTDQDMTVPNSIVAFRSVEIMDVTMRVFDEADPDSEANIKVTMTDHQSYSYTVKRVMGEMITFPAVTKESGRKYEITVETFQEKYSPKRKVSRVVLADQYYKFVNLTIPKASSTFNENATPKRTTSISKLVFFLPIVAIVLVAYFNRESLPGWYHLALERLGAAQKARPDSRPRDDNRGDEAVSGVRKRTKKRLS